MIQLSRKIEYDGHVFFKAICPDSVNTDFSYLKENNLICFDVTHLPTSLTSLAFYQIPDAKSRSDLLGQMRTPLTGVSIIHMKFC